MDCKFMSLKELSNGCGMYGIAAPAVDYNPTLPTYLRITDIDDYGNIIKENLKSVTSPNISKYMLSENDVVFARTGNSTGRFYVYDKRDGDYAFAGFLIKFNLNTDLINPKYLKYYLLSKEYRGWVTSNITGSTRGNINAKQFGEMIIPVPPKHIQDNIVDIIQIIDDKIRYNHKINANLGGDCFAL